MKFNMTIPLVIVAFIAGYFTGNYNTTSPRSAKENVASGHPSSQNSTAPAPATPQISEEPAATTPVTTSLPATPATQQTTAQVATKDSPKTTIQDDDASSNKPSNSPSTTSASQSDFPLAQQELDEWITTYKQSLKSRMQEQMGSNEEWMADQIAENNKWLTDPKAESSFDDNVAWRYQMEQQLTDFILQSITDPAMELVNVTCMQKQCSIEMTGTNNQEGVKVYAGILSSKPFDMESASQPTFYMSDSESFWMYFSLHFH